MDIGEERVLTYYYYKIIIRIKAIIKLPEEIRQGDKVIVNFHGDMNKTIEFPYSDDFKLLNLNELKNNDMSPSEIRSYLFEKLNCKKQFVYLDDYKEYHTNSVLKLDILTEEEIPVYI